VLGPAFSKTGKFPAPIRPGDKVADIVDDARKIVRFRLRSTTTKLQSEGEEMIFPDKNSISTIKPRSEKVTDLGGLAFSQSHEAVLASPGLN
jgi:hypothetical protein